MAGGPPARVLGPAGDVRHVAEWHVEGVPGEGTPEHAHSPPARVHALVYDLGLGLASSSVIYRTPSHTGGSPK